MQLLREPFLNFIFEKYIFPGLCLLGFNLAMNSSLGVKQAMANEAIRCGMQPAQAAKNPLWLNAIYSLGLWPISAWKSIKNLFN